MIKNFKQFVNEDLDHTFKPNTDNIFDKKDLAKGNMDDSDELKTNFEKSYELFEKDKDNSTLKAYALCQLAIYLLSKTDQLNSSGSDIEEDVELLMSYITKGQADFQNLEENETKKVKDLYKSVYNWIVSNVEDDEFSKYVKEFIPK
jgi:hypothetical protein